MDKVIRLFSTLTDEAADALKGTFVGWEHYGRLLGPADGDVDVLKPDGTPLLLYRPGVLDPAVCDRAFPALRHAATATFNRGVAAGGGRSAKRKKDGTLSLTTYAREVESGLAGFFDRTAREPYCRTTAFTADEAGRWRASLPFIRAVDLVFREECPDRYAAQLAAVDQTPPEWVIPGTVFTTVTVNRNYRSAVHKDAGDLKAGFGVLSVFRRGEYDGGLLVFPAFRVAVDLHETDVLLCDVHEWHGNTALVGVPGTYERLSCVMYYRAGMRYCLPPAEELERAKRRRPGDPLN